jgi:hypothetical protein
LAIIVSLLVGPVGVGAVALGLGLLPLPYPLFLVLQRLPVAFPLHMVASGLALILIPIAAFLRHRRVIHRAAGRAAAVCVVVGGTTALLVAMASEATFGARAGLCAQGLVWLALLAAAVVAIRRGAVATHARLMIAMAAVASGAIWLRLFVYAAVSAGLPFDPAYAAAAWVCWMVPLALAAVASRRLDLSPAFFSVVIQRPEAVVRPSIL